LVLGLIGLGVETGLWYQTQHELQTAADAAALAGALELHNGNTATYVAIAKMESQRNSVQDGVNNQTVTINSPPLAPDPYAGNKTAVQAITTRKQNLLFSALFLSGGSITINAAGAVAASSGPGVCLLALNPSQNNAMQYSGSATHMLTNCAVVSGTHTAVTNGVTAALPNGTPSYPGQTDYLYSLCVPTSGSSLGTPASPGVSCGSGNTKNTYVGVTVTDGAMIPVPFFGLGSTLTVTGQAILRVSSADTLRTLQS
jgi:Flp pilus assembly protein TadG